MKKDKDKERGEVSRRDFLVGAGAVVVGGAIGAGITYPLVSGGDGEVSTVTKTVSVPTTVTKTVGDGATATVTDTVTTTVGAGQTATVTNTVPGPTVTTTVGGGGVSPVDEPEVSVFRGAGLGNFGRDNTAMRVDTKDGKIVRIRPMHYDHEGYGADWLKPWAITVNGATLQPHPGLKSQAPTIGLSYKKRVYSPNRVKYPLKRVDWEPGGVNVNPQNRGISKYKRISWDEATDIIASELVRIQDKYGYFAVLTQADGHGEGKVVHGPHGCMTQLLRWMGPDTKSSYTLQVRTPDSWEGWYWGAKHMWGMETRGNRYPGTNATTETAKNCELMINIGDKETTTGIISGQFISDVMFWLSEVGVEQVYLSPDLNYSGCIHADKWIPVLPCQDVALFLAIAHVWLTEGTYDQDYLDDHSVGFDKYKDVVMGNAADGIEKTPEWASPLCGVPVHTIKALARNWAQKRTSGPCGGNGGAFIRGPYSTEPARTVVALLAMQGVGKPGRHLFRWGGLPGSQYSFSFDKTLVRGEPCPARGLEEWESAYDYFRPHSFIPKTLIHEAILNTPIAWNGGTGSAGMLTEDQFRSFEFPIPAAEGGSDIHMIWTSTPCWTACWNGGNRYIQALREPNIEFVLTEHPWLENDTMLSDIILPTTTKYEEYDICGPRTPESYGCVTINRDCIAPVGESKSDYQVSIEVGKKLENMGYPGLVEKYSWGRSVEDWMEYGYDTREIEEKTGMTWEQFKEREIYIDPTRPDWEERLEADPGGKAFYEDPAANPLQTPTGLIEFESTGLLQHYPEDRERPPVPNWVPGGPRSEGWSMDETLLSDRAVDYPFLVISNHPRWGEHAQNDDNAWCREVIHCKVPGPDGYKYQPCWLNPISAEPLGIKTGDVISLYNERGTILCGAYVTERIIPGAAYVDHIARLDPIFTGSDAPRSEWIDRGGEINLICPDDPGIVSQNAPGQVASGFLVGIKRTDLDDLRVRYPEAFARAYDPDSGLRFDGWVEGGM